MKPAPFEYHRPTSLARSLRPARSLRRRRSHPGRRPEPGARAQHAPGHAAGGHRHQPAARPRRHSRDAGGAGHRRAGAPRDGRALGARARARAAARRGDAPRRSRRHPHARHVRREPRPRRSRRRAAGLRRRAGGDDPRARAGGGGATWRRPTSSAAIYTTALAPGEIVTEIVVPAPVAGWRAGFEELARRHGDFALAGLAAGRACRAGRHRRRRGSCSSASARRPVRAGGAEAALIGRRPDADTLAAARRALDADLDPPGDVHGSPALRRHLAGRAARPRGDRRLVEERA